MIATQVVGTGISAYGQHQAGKQAEQAYGYNAQLAREQGAEAERVSRRKLKSLLSSQRALYAKAGVDITEGSPLMVLSETAAEGEREALALRRGYRSEAYLQELYGKQAGRTGLVGAAGTLLTGLGSAGSNYYFYNKTK